jgi:adenylate cyclase
VAEIDDPDPELVAALRAQGFSRLEIADAARHHRLALLPVDRVLQGGEPRYTRTQLADQVGLPLDLMIRLWRELGLAEVADDATVFTESDLDAVRAVARFHAAGLDEETLASVTHVIGQGMSRLAGSVRELVGEALLQAGDDERSVGLRYAQAADALVPLLAPVLAYVLRVHLRDQIKSDVLRREEITAGRFDTARRMYICFADLVGFTSLGERVPVEELRSAGRHLTSMAVAAAESPVRLVKVIGDAAMLVSPEPEPLVRAALELVARADRPEEAMPPLSAGIACGDAIPDSGDWYGAPVNLASRVTQAARPSSVLTTADVRDEVDEAFSWSYADTRRFKGIRHPVALYRARPLSDGS